MAELAAGPGGGIAVAAGIEIMDEFAQMYRDKENSSHKSDKTAQNTAREIIENIYKDELNVELKKEAKFIDSRLRIYGSIDEAKADSAKQVRYNVKNLLEHKSPYVKNELTKAINELRKDTEKFKEAAENGWLNHQVKHTNLIADSAASQVKELIALMGGNVSIHDGIRYPVKDLIFDGHGQVHGDETDWHYNERARWKAATER